MDIKIFESLIDQKEQEIQKLKEQIAELNKAKDDKNKDSKKKASEWRTKYYRERYQNDSAFRERIKQQKLEYARKKREAAQKIGGI